MFYLGIDFLEKAVSSRRNVLTTCLISVPQHLDHVKTYPHSGKLPDDAYRFPWKIVKTNRSFSQEECANILKDGSLVTEKVKCKHDTVEAFHSTVEVNASITEETANFQLECDVVPSSNPSTPDVFTPDDFFTERTVFQEYFSQDDLGRYIPDFEKLMVEECIHEDVLTEAIKGRPTIQCLVSQLPPVHVTDPLLTVDGHIHKEELIFRDTKQFDGSSDIVPILQQEQENKFTHEEFNKYENLHKLENENILESPITEGADLPDSETVTRTAAELLLSSTGPLERFSIEEEQPVLELLSDAFSDADKLNTEKLENIDITLEEKTPTTFLDLNEIVITEKDKFCENASLATPVQSPTVAETEERSILMPKREVLDVTHCQEKFLTKSEVDKLLRLYWEAEKYSDEIQASRLPEPDISYQDDVDKTDIVKKAMKTLKVVLETDIGKLDLKLPWQIVKQTELLSETCTNLAQLDTDRSKCAVQLKPVDAVEKYSAAIMYDWTDPHISLHQKEERQSVKIKTDTKALPARVPQGKRSLKVKESNDKAFDPLMHFMALRSKPVQDKVKDKQTLTKEVEVTSQRNEQAEIPDQIAEIKKNFESKKKTKHHVVKIKLSEEFQHILDMLESSSATYLQQLIQSGDVTASSTFHTITPDISRFLLKQRAKHMLDTGIDMSSDEVYRNIICLHGLVSTADIAVNCCLESAIGYLGTLHDKYKTVIAGSLDTVRQQLFELKAQFYQRTVHHPKVVSLCKEIEVWLKKKRAKSRDSEQKILILIKRDMSSLTSCLKNALNLSKQLSPEILTTNISEQIIACLDKHNCVLAHQKLITDSFPWSQFSFVVEYEHQDNSQWQQLCERQHIRHLGLQLLNQQEHETHATAEWRMRYPDRHISLIASQNITKNTQLLQLLEARHNIMLVERDYSLLRGTGHLYFSDLDVDENTGIVLQELQEMVDDCVAEGLVTKIAALSLKYTSIWVILVANNKTGSYMLSGHVISNLSKLQATVANFVMKDYHIDVKVVQCDSTVEVASLIRYISERCMTEHKDRPISDWLHRTWLSQDISQVEKFLLMLPCLSSFNAQLLVKETNLRTLFSAGVSDLTKNMPWMSAKTLKTFAKFASSKTGLNLRDTDTPNDNADDLYHDMSHARKNIIKHTVDDEVSLENKQGDKDAQRKNIYVHEDFQYENAGKALDYGQWQANTGDEAFQIVNSDLPNEYAKTHTSDTDVHDDDYIKGQTDESCEYSVDSYSFVATRIPTDQVTLDSRENIRGDRTETDQRDLTPVEKLKLQQQRDLMPKKAEVMTQIDKNSSCYFQANIETLPYIQHKVNDTQQGLGRHASYLDGDYNENTQFQQEPTSVHRMSSEGTKSYFDMYPEETSISEPFQSDICHQNGRQIDTNPQVYLKQQEQLQAESKARLFQNQIGEPSCIKTFDYNHGLPFEYDHNKQPTIETTQTEFNHLALNSNRLLHQNHQQYIQRHRVDEFEKEFPSAEEIDKSVSMTMNNESISDLGYTEPSRQNSDTLQSYDFPKGDYNTKGMYYTDNPLMENWLNTADIVNFQNDPDRRYLKDVRHTNVDIKHDDKFALQFLPVVTSSRCEASDKREVRFDFNPVIINDYNTDGVKTQNDKPVEGILESKENGSLDLRPELTAVDSENIKKHHGGRVYFNPEMERLTMKPDFIENPVSIVTNDPDFSRSLEDDLRETTRKLLANSQQFSRLGSHCGKNYLQKLSIGLAQPVQRQKEPNNKTSDQRHEMSEAERLRMAMSPWATGDSPPMDLDYDNFQMNHILYPDQPHTNDESTNRAVFNSHTPSKKRKLTYQKMPGKRGQTKLVFQ